MYRYLLENNVNFELYNLFFCGQTKFVTIQSKGSVFMEKQKINCTVESCKFNDGRSRECILKQITVTPVDGVDTANPDESMCSSYENFDL